MIPRAADVPSLHVVTDDRILGRPELIGVAEALLDEGGPSLAFHVRGPHTVASTVYEVTKALLPASRRSGAVLAVNDRIDVALAVGAGAVHLGARSLPAALARRLLGEAVLIGRSTHERPEVAEEARSDVDFLFFGNVWSTPSHPDRPGVGEVGVREAVDAAGSVAVIAIGGVDVGRVPSAIEAGAQGVAVVRGVWDAADPVAAVREYISAFERMKR